MSQLITNDSSLTSIANAIRTKGGTSAQLVYPNGFVEAINAISGGGGGSDDYFWIEGDNKVGSIASIVDIVRTGPKTQSYNYQFQSSADKETWTDLTFTNNRIRLNIGKRQKIYLRNNSNYLSFDSSNYINFNCQSSDDLINIGGRINSLCNNIDGKSLYSYCFYNLFNYSYVKKADELVLPQHTAPNCYENMFMGCTKLTTAPALPATVLDFYCYNYMFFNCRSLTTAPALPATTLASNCYNSMFYGCTALTTAPALPATTLASNCYYDMFRDCTALTTAPALPATTLISGCYSGMFYGCTALKVYSESGEGHDKPWSIPTNGAIQGYTRAQSGMFNGVETDNVPADFPGVAGQQYTYYTANTPVA